VFFVNPPPVAVKPFNNRLAFDRFLNSEAPRSFKTAPEQRAALTRCSGLPPFCAAHV
jgi:hypothetical protein